MTTPVPDPAKPTSVPVTPIGITRIASRLDAFDGLIDMSDYDNRPTQKRTAFLSRALAAYTVRAMTGVEFPTAAASLTDAYHDRGIDAIYYHPPTLRLILVQSKWSSGIDWKEVGEFIDGVRKLIEPNEAAFSKNQKISKRWTEIRLALESSAKLVLVTVHHGPQETDKSAKKRVDDFVQEIDGGSGLAQSIHWIQKDVLAAIQDEAEPPTISADLYSRIGAKSKNRTTPFSDGFKARR